MKNDCSFQEKNKNFQVRLFSSSSNEKILKSLLLALFFDLIRVCSSSRWQESGRKARLECLEELKGKEKHIKSYVIAVTKRKTAQPSLYK